MQFHQLNAIFTALSPHPYDDEISLQTPSAFALENLFYFKFIQEIDVLFPFALECKTYNGYLIIHTKEGSCLLNYAKEQFSLTPDTILFINCATPFQLELIQSTCWKADLLMLNGLKMTSYYEFITSEHQHLFKCYSTLNMPLLIDKLYDLAEKSSPTNDFVISKVITDLLTNLILTKEMSQTALPNIPKYLLQVKDYFDSNYHVPIHLDELAKTYHISKYKIIRDFQTYYHCSPISYLIDKRMIVAKKLLIETDHPVCEIACEVGIDNINHFTNLFKKNTGMTPSSYRRKCHIDLSDCNA